jgi:minichromosome maintenance protein 10
MFELMTRKEKRKTAPKQPAAGPSSAVLPALSFSSAPSHSAKPLDKQEAAYVKPAASNVVSKLASLSSRASSSTDAASAARSSTFSQPATVSSDSAAPKRDDRLALVEELEPGPIEHNPPPGDPMFETLEPYSGIRLSYVLSF